MSAHQKFLDSSLKILRPTPRDRLDQHAVLPMPQQNSTAMCRDHFSKISKIYILWQVSV